MATDIKFEYEEIDAVSPYYKDFFRRDDVQEHLMKNNLSEVYKICYDSLLNKSDVGLFTLTLYYLGIDVLIILIISLRICSVIHHCHMLTYLTK